MINRLKQSDFLGTFIVALGAIFYFYEYFLRIAPSVMKDQWMREFHIDATLFGTLSGFYFLAYTPMQVVVGVMIDRFNIRNIMTFAVICCIIGSFMMAVTDSYTVVGIGRYLQGFGSAFGFVGALKLATIWLPTKRFAFFSGMCCMGGFFGAAIGQIGLNYMVERTGWRESIEIFTVFGLFITVAFIMFLGLHPKNTTCESLNTKTTLVQMMKQFGHIMKKGNLWLAGIVSSLMFFPTSVFAALWGKTYIQAIHPDFTATQASMTSAMIFIGWGLGSPLQGYLSDRLNRRMPLLLLGSFCAAILAGVALYNASLNFYAVCIVFILFGMFSSAQILTFSVARDLCTASLAGTAVAFINTLAMVPGLVFQSGMGYILDIQRNGRVDALGEPLYLAQDYRNAFIIIPILLTIACVLCMIGFKNERQLKKMQATMMTGE